MVNGKLVMLSRGALFFSTQQPRYLGAVPVNFSKSPKNWLFVDLPPGLGCIIAYPF